MARLIGDTKQTGRYLRVCTEKTNNRVTIQGFSSLRNADGRGLNVTQEELPVLIELLQRAQFSMSNPTIKRDTPKKRKRTKATKMKKSLHSGGKKNRTTPTKKTELTYTEHSIGVSPGATKTNT